MKKTIVILASIAFMVSAASAETKPCSEIHYPHSKYGCIKDAPATVEQKYPLTGTAQFEATQSTSEIHVSAQGHSYDAYCSADNRGASCTSSPGYFTVL